MGEITEMILEGLLCETCCAFIDEDAAGYPRQCFECKAAKEEDLKNRESFYKNQIRDTRG